MALLPNKNIHIYKLNKFINTDIGLIRLFFLIIIEKKDKDIIKFESEEKNSFISSIQ
jgi:hypothetical protein